MVTGPPPHAPKPAAPTPEQLSTRKGLEAWLRTQPIEVSVIIAARASLRVLPLFVAVQLGDESRFPNLTAALWRAAALARVAGKYPIHANELRSRAAADAAYSAAAAADTTAAAAPARAAANAAEAAAAAAATRAASNTANDVAHVDDGFAAAHAARAYAAASIGAGAADAATASDARKAAQGGAEAIVDAALWPSGAPTWAAEARRRLLDRLPPYQDWDVWREWYEDRLRGGSRGEAYELVFATVPESEWEKGAAAANRWIREHLPASSPNRTPRQRPALHAFRLSDGKIALAPDGTHPADAETTQDLLESARRRVEEMRKRLENAQADRRLQNTLRALGAQLAARLADVRLGLLADAYFALDADFDAYDSPEGRAEHAVDLIADLGSLRKTVRALIGRFDQGREILAEAAELDLSETPGALEKAETASAEIAEIVKKYPALVEAEVADAALAPAESIAQSRTRSERSRHVALRLLTDDNLANGLADARKFALETWEQVRKQAAKAAGKAVVGIPAAALALWLGQHGVELLLETAGAIAGINAALGKKGGAFAEALSLLRHYAARKPIDPAPESDPPAEPKARKDPPRKLPGKPGAPSRRSVARKRKAK